VTIVAILPGLAVAHTVQGNGINPRCGGMVWGINSGMAEYYGGRIEVLEIEGDRVRVLR
jgi:hypothetical protein